LENRIRCDQGGDAIYANLRAYNQVAFAPIAVESMGSDDAEKGSSPSDASFMNKYDDYSVTSTDGQLLDFWSGKYQSINLCNQVLDNIPAISMDASLKARYIAEAKFVRAYNYFRLVRAFGDVPLRLTIPKTPAEYNLKRSPKAQVWAAIEQDLTDAEVLPVSYGGADVGRITKALYWPCMPRWPCTRLNGVNVLAFTNQVMGLGYSLFPNFEQVFRVTNENSTESVFEIQCAIVQGNPSASNSQYSQVQG